MILSMVGCDEVICYEF